MTALHELTGEFLALSKDEDIDPAAIKDTLEAISGSLHEKAISLADWSMDLDGNIGQIDAAIERLEKRKKQIKSRKESLIDYLRENMEACDIKKISCPLFTITLVEGRDSVAISDESLLPDEFVTVKTVIAPDKIAISKAIKEGQEVAGASLQKGQSSIRIK